MQIKKLLLILSLILAFLGFLDATYLSILHFKHTFPPCSLAHTCEAVLTSKYATIGSIPIALLGSLYYATAMILSGFLLQKPSPLPSALGSLLFVLVTSGLLVSIALVYIQAAVLHAFCQYCLASEAICAGLWIGASLLMKIKRG